MFSLMHNKNLSYAELRGFIEYEKGNLVNAMVCSIIHLHWNIVYYFSAPNDNTSLQVACYVLFKFRVIYYDVWRNQWKKIMRLKSKVVI